MKAELAQNATNHQTLTLAPKHDFNTMHPSITIKNNGDNGTIHVCVRARARARACVCVCERERERENSELNFITQGLRF